MLSNCICGIMKRSFFVYNRNIRWDLYIQVQWKPINKILRVEAINGKKVQCRLYYDGGDIPKKEV